MTKSRLLAKPHVVSMMSVRFPQHHFSFTRGVRYFFRRDAHERMYEFVVYQRDGKAGAFNVDLAVTYNPAWEGSIPNPLGSWATLRELARKRNRPFINALENWYLYRNSEDQLVLVLKEIASHLRSHGMRFFERARRTLKADTVLQAGLDALGEEGPIEDRLWSELNDDLARAKHILADVHNQTLDLMIKRITTRLTAAPPPGNKETHIRKVACDLLYYSREIAGPPPAQLPAI